MQLGCLTPPCPILQDLSLAGNQLTKLPDSIGKLRNLQRLQLAGNLLTSLPDSLCNLTALEVCAVYRHDHEAFAV